MGTIYSRLLMSLSILATAFGIGFTADVTFTGGQIISEMKYDSGQAFATRYHDTTYDKWTILTNGVQQTGYYGTDGGFIAEQIQKFHANGTVASSQDVINGKTMSYNTAGILTSITTDIDVSLNGGGIKHLHSEVTVGNGITLDAKGRLVSIETQGWIDKNKNQAFDGGNELATTSKEFYMQDGRIDHTENYVDNLTNQPETSKTVYEYDSTGRNVEKTTTYDKDNKIVGYSTYQDGKVMNIYTLTKPGDMKSAYVSQAYHYEFDGKGRKLLDITQYKQDNKHSINSVVTFDQHGRESKIHEGGPKGEVIQSFVYNDTSKTRTIRASDRTDVDDDEKDSQKVIVAAGGLMYQKVKNGDDMTYILYHNGSKNFQAFQYDAMNATAQK